MRKLIATTLSLLAAGVGSGLAAGQTFTPPAAATSVQSVLYSDPTNNQENALSVDAVGNLYFVRPGLDGMGDGSFFEKIAATGAEVTLIGGNTLSYPKGVASDNSYGYVSDFHGNLWKVPNGGGTAINILGPCIATSTGAPGPVGSGYYLGTQAVAADGNGNVYVAGNNVSGIFKITAAGACTAVANVATDANSRIAVDAAGDLSYSLNQNTLYSLPANATTPTVAGTLTSGATISGLRSDAFGNVFVTTGTSIVEVPFVAGALSYANAFTSLPSTSASDIGVGANGNLYTTDGTSFFLNTPGRLRFAATAVGSHRRQHAFVSQGRGVG